MLATPVSLSRGQLGEASGAQQRSTGWRQGGSSSPWMVPEDRRLPRERRRREEERPRAEPRGTPQGKGPAEEGNWRGG